VSVDNVHTEQQRDTEQDQDQDGDGHHDDMFVVHVQSVVVIHHDLPRVGRPRGMVRDGGRVSVILH